MKKVLLAGTALLGLALTSAPASAELNLDLGGHFRGYGVFNDNDQPAGTSTHDFDLRRDTEIHFTGEATSDNGLTVGAHYEAFVGGDLVTDEAYAYFAGNWGRVNLGSEDGAAYLLQVAAPSADSNVDGLRTSVQAIDSFAGSAFTPIGGGVTGFANTTGYTGAFTDQFSTTAALGGGSLLLDYDHADFQDTDRLTYLTPKFSGFQAGVSYAPEAGQKLTGNAVAAPGVDDGVNQFENLWELAARWDGEFEGFGISAGAGYSHASVEAVATTALAGGAVGDIADDLETWNAGLNVAFRGFSVGGAYLQSETSTTATLAAPVPPPAFTTTDLESKTWVVGAAWDNGPYHVGVSYLDQEIDTAGVTREFDRWTLGAGYTYGPGMSFRGALAMGNGDNGVAGVGNVDQDFTQVTLGTDIQF